MSKAEYVFLLLWTEVTFSCEIVVIIVRNICNICWDLSIQVCFWYLLWADRIISVPASKFLGIDIVMKIWWRGSWSRRFWQVHRLERGNWWRNRSRMTTTNGQEWTWRTTCRSTAADCVPSRTKHFLCLLCDNKEVRNYEIKNKKKIWCNNFL